MKIYSTNCNLFELVSIANWKKSHTNRIRNILFEYFTKKMIKKKWKKWKSLPSQWLIFNVWRLYIYPKTRAIKFDDNKKKKNPKEENPLFNIIHIEKKNLSEWNANVQLNNIYIDKEKLIFNYLVILAQKK